MPPHNVQGVRSALCSFIQLEHPVVQRAPHPLRPNTAFDLQGAASASGYEPHLRVLK